VRAATDAAHATKTQQFVVKKVNEPRDATLDFLEWEL
jgi:hypothetical protein